VRTATRETTSNAGILWRWNRSWVMFVYTQDDIYPFSYTKYSI
jgi:hypothetical protein